VACSSGKPLSIRRNPRVICSEAKFVHAILGIQVPDRADLEASGEATAARDHREFMLTVNLLALVNATATRSILSSPSAARGDCGRNVRTGRTCVRNGNSLSTGRLP
jgi:hypothetical protein